MSEHELMAFNAYWDIEARSQDEYLTAKNAWKACAERKDKEIAALRGFAKAVVDGGFHNGNASVFGLIDENGKLTKLLTGESK